MIRFVGVSSTDSTLSHRWAYRVLPGFGLLAVTLSGLGYHQALVLWRWPYFFLEPHPLVRLSHHGLLGITRLWSSGNNLTIVGVSPTGSTLSHRACSHRPATSPFCWLTPRVPLKYPSAIQHPGRVLPSLSVLLGAPSTGTSRSPLGSSPRAI